MHDKVEMSTMMLRALTKTLKTSPKRKHGQAPQGQANQAEGADGGDENVDAEKLARALILAVNWNRVDIANEILKALSADRMFTYAHQIGMRRHSRATPLFISSCDRGGPLAAAISPLFCLCSRNVLMR